MVAPDPPWLVYQRKRWMRPDASRWMRPDAHIWKRPGFDAATAHIAVDRKYDPDQPRVPAGEPDGGQWTTGGNSPPDFDIIFERALQFAKQNGQIAIAGPGNYQRCLDICYPLLERFQRPGSDKNTTDFQKCMNACVRGLRWR